MRRPSLVFAAIALAATASAGCSRAVEPADAATVPTNQVTSTTFTPATTLAPPSTTTVPPTTTTPPPTVTTTTQAPLDMSEAAVLARLEEDMSGLLANGPRPAGSESEAAAAAYLAGVLAGIGLTPQVTAVALPTGDESANVMVTIGKGPRRVLLGAHYDTVAVSPGADDNGSGTVVLLELARRLAERSPDELTVTIVFFGAEEVITGRSKNDHHYGSRALADELAAAGALPDEMISVDMVGYGDDMLAAVYRGGATSAADRLVDAATTHGVRIERSIRGDISDHEAFARAGVPAVMMWRPWNPGYHTAEDDVVNWDHLVATLAVIETWLSLQSG